jgi:hypothetical protein
LHLENWDKEAKVEEQQQRLEKVVPEVLPELQEHRKSPLMGLDCSEFATAIVGVGPIC